MVGQSRPRSVGGRRLLWRFPIAIAIVLAVGLLLASDLPAELRRAISGLSQVIGALAVAAACLLRFRASTGRRRQAWLFFSISGVMGAAGGVGLWAAGPASGPGEPTSPANTFIALALLSGVAGMVLYPSVPRRITELARMVLDGVVLGGSILYIASLTVVPQMLRDTSTPYPERLLPLVGPLVEVVIATVAALLYWRAAPADRPSLGLGCVGFALYAFSASALAIRTAEGEFVLGSITDLGWIAGHATLALAISVARTAPRTETPKELSPILGTVMMFGLFIAAAVVNVLPGTPSTTPVAAVLWLVVLLGVAGRQIFVILDNERLRRGLEERVAERTSDLRKLNQRTALLLNSVGDGIYGVDRDGLITFANPAAAHALGRRADQLIGRDPHAAFHAAADAGTSAHPAEECYVTAAIQDRLTTTAAEDVYLRADGLEIPVELTATPLTEDGQVRGAVVVFRDVTQRREVDHMKSEFVSMVSHELRTPLTSIRGALGLLHGGALGEITPRAARMVQIALESSDRLTRLINDILDLERIEAGVMTLKNGYLAVDQLLGAAAAHVQLLAEQSGIRIAVTPSTGRVFADADRVEQTLINLLGNAIKFSPRGTTVRLAAVELGVFVEFVVADQGRGIPPDQLEEIFARFQQVDSSDARAKGGSGLGLAISRSLVERMGGRIWADNTPGGGASFYFTLPTEPEFAYAPEPVSVRPQHNSTSASGPEATSRPQRSVR